MTKTQDFKSAEEEKPQIQPGLLYSTEAVADMMKDGECYWIVNRFDGATWTTKDRILEIMKELGSGWWEVTYQGPNLQFKPIEYAAVSKKPVEQKPKKGKVRLI